MKNNGLKYLSFVSMVFLQLEKTHHSLDECVHPLLPYKKIIGWVICKQLPSKQLDNFLHWTWSKGQLGLCLLCPQLLVIGHASNPTQHAPKHTVGME